MPVVDVQFPLRGRAIPADHGYALFAAVSKWIPGLHSDRSVGVHPVTGRLIGGRLLALTRQSFLTIRIPSERVGEIVRLAGKKLDLGGTRLNVGVPRARSIRPSPQLYSRLVVVKGFTEPEPFLLAVRRQLAAVDVTVESSLIPQPEIVEANRDRNGGTRSPYLRRTLRIHNKEIVGFAIRVEGLKSEESVRLQESGLGGRRRFGCGIFVPTHDRR